MIQNTQIPMEFDGLGIYVLDLEAFATVSWISNGIYCQKPEKKLMGCFIYFINFYSFSPSVDEPYVFLFDDL